MFFCFFAELFHVEHLKIWLFIALFSVFSFSCTKRDPTPEIKDPIYNDIKSQQGIAEKALIDINSKINQTQSELASAVPQTGQIRLLQRKLFQLQKERDIYQQQVKYWIVRLEERAKQARLSYNEAFTAGKIWPDPKEYEVYLSEKKLRLAKIEWDAKQRLEDYKNDLKLKSAPPKTGH